MAAEPKGNPRSTGKDAAGAAAASFVVTLIASLAVFPLSIGVLGVATPVGSFALSLIVPVLCDLYVYRKFFAVHPRPSRTVFLVVGLALSALLALFTWGPLVIAVGA